MGANLKDINPVISVINGKVCVNGIIFEHNELRELKLYLQKIGAEEAHFYPSNKDNAEELEEVIVKMANLTPEASGHDMPSYYLN